MTATTIVEVAGRRVWDSRGRPTVEAEVVLGGGARGRAIAPAGASTGSGEAIDLRDHGTAHGGYGVGRAVAAVNAEIRAGLTGMDASNQRVVDERLIELDGTENKGRLGGNALIAVSMANAHAAAADAGVALWRYLSPTGRATLPLPEIQILGGGAHAGRRIDVQDYMVVPAGAKSFEEGLDWTAEVYAAAGRELASRGLLRGVADEGGYWPEFERNEEALELLVASIEAARLVPGEQMVISLDVAASELGRSGRYHLALEERALDSDGMGELLGRWIERFPIASVEDPLGEDDRAGLQRFTAAYGDRVQIVGDDYLVTNAARVRRAQSEGICNAALIKPNQAGTLSETHDALTATHEGGWDAIVSARSGETEDITIVHLAIGWGAGQLKVGSFARSERMAKWNEALRIEESLGRDRLFAGRAPLRRYYEHP